MIPPRRLGKEREELAGGPRVHSASGPSVSLLKHNFPLDGSPAPLDRPFPQFLNEHLLPLSSPSTPAMLSAPAF
jgi:hypothetical protein